MAKKEESIQLAVCKYIKLQYPDVIFTSESSGIRLTIGQAVKAKKMRSNHKLPDLWILEPKGMICGLLIELKVGNPYKMNGQPKTPHFAHQLETIELLKKKGYSAIVCSSFDEAKKSIDNYLKRL